MLDSQSYSVWQISELASAIATAELKAGNIRAARKLFRKALIEPNENTVAQVVFASKEIGDLDLSPAALDVPLSFEARACERFKAGDWNVSMSQCWGWLRDQPFSSRPAILGSYIAAIPFRDLPESERIARQGLIANPTDPGLLNNLTFTLANLGRLHEAEQAQSLIERSHLNDDCQVAWLATSGLLRYRRGSVDEGRQLYIQAIDMAQRLRLRKLHALASIFFALEEIAFDPLGANEYKTRALDAAKDLTDPDVQVLVARLKEFSVVNPV